MAREWIQGDDCDRVKDQRRNRPRVAKKKKEKKESCSADDREICIRPFSGEANRKKKKSEGYYVSFIILP